MARESIQRPGEVGIAREQPACWAASKLLHSAGCLGEHVGRVVREACV